AITPRRINTVTALIASNVTTTRWVGEMGVRSASTTKVAKADSKASPAAIGPRTRTARAPAGAAVAVRSAASDGSMLVTLAMDPDGNAAAQGRQHGCVYTTMLPD